MNTDTEYKWHIETQHGARPKETKGLPVTSAHSFPVGHAQWASDRNKTSSENQYKCKECTAVFTLESMFNEHMNGIHNVNYSMKYTKCSNVFNSHEEVEEHVKQKHNNVSSLESAVLQMCQQMNSMSQKIESLERNSLTNFPNLVPRPAKK